MRRCHPPAHDKLCKWPVVPSSIAFAATSKTRFAPHFCDTPGKPPCLPTPQWQPVPRTRARLWPARGFVQHCAVFVTMAVNAYIHALRVMLIQSRLTAFPACGCAFFTPVLLGGALLAVAVAFLCCDASAFLRFNPLHPLQVPGRPFLVIFFICPFENLLSGRDFPHT